MRTVIGAVSFVAVAATFILVGGVETANAAPNFTCDQWRDYWVNAKTRDFIAWKGDPYWKCYRTGYEPRGERAPDHDSEGRKAGSSHTATEHSVAKECYNCQRKLALHDREADRDLADCMRDNVKRAGRQCAAGVRRWGIGDPIPPQVRTPSRKEVCGWETIRIYVDGKWRGGGIKRWVCRPDPSAGKLVTNPEWSACVEDFTNGLGTRRKTKSSYDGEANLPGGLGSVSYNGARYEESFGPKQGTNDLCWDASREQAAKSEPLINACFAQVRKAVKVLQEAGALSKKYSCEKKAAKL